MVQTAITVPCRVCGVPLPPGTPGDHEDTCLGCLQRIAADRVGRLVANGIPGWETLARMLFGEEAADSASDPAGLRETARAVTKCVLGRYETGQCLPTGQCPLSTTVEDIEYGCVSWRLLVRGVPLLTGGVCGRGEFVLCEDGCAAVFHLLGMEPA